MTESEWFTCADLMQMMDVVRGRASERKLRLFAVACCRRLWQEITAEQSRAAVLVAEKFADGQATNQELESAANAACAVWDAEFQSGDDGSCKPMASMAAYNVAIPMEWWGGAPSFVAPWVLAQELAPDPVSETQAQCELLRDIIGNPFHLRTPQPVSDQSAIDLAQDIYLHGRFDQMPFLADVLAKAGQADAAMLAHCRQPGPHVRGCLALDSLLGK